MQETEHLAHYKLVLLIFFILFFAERNSAQDFLPPKTDSLITLGLDAIINQNYDEAKQYFLGLEKYDKIDPLGKIYLAVTSISRSFDLGEEYNWDYISKLLGEAIDIAEKNYEKDPMSVMKVYTLALAEGYNAYIKGLNNNWFSAISNGYEAIGNFEKCLMIDSTFYDAYTAIGTFKYWKSKKVSFLPMVSDERNLGIKYLELATTKSRHSNYLAVNSLLWVYIDTKEYSKTIELANKILSKYPRSRLFKWGLARAYESIDFKKSIEVYNEILNDYNSIKGLNGYHQIVLMHLIAQLEYRDGNKPKALELCNIILNKKNLSEYVKDELDNRLERVKQLRESIIESTK